MRSNVLGVLAVTFLVASSLTGTTLAAAALVESLQEPAPAADAEPFVGPGFVDSFTVSCDTTATLIQASGGQVSYSAQVDDAAGGDIAFGDSGVATTTGHAIGPGEFNSGNLRTEYCRAASAAKTIRVRALVATAPAGLALDPNEHHCRKGYVAPPNATHPPCTVWH